MEFNAENLKAIEWVRVESSNIEAVGYLEDGKIFLITFKGKPDVLWIFMDVPLETYQLLLEAESKGSYFARFIKGKFPSQQYTMVPKSVHDAGAAA